MISLSINTDSYNGRLSVQNSRLIVVGRVQRLGVGRRVAIEDVAVLDGIRLPRPLVFGKVPARGELGLQRLRAAGQSE